MKSHNLSYIFVVIFSIISACSSDDDLSTSNSLQINGEPFTVTSASILGVSLGGAGHAAITLVSTNLSTTRTLTIDFDYVANQPIAGDYAYPQSANQGLLDDWLTNYSEFNGTTSSNSLHLQEGELTIIDNGGNNYTITMDLTMDDGTTKFSGTYQGDFQVFFNNG